MREANAAARATATACRWPPDISPTTASMSGSPDLQPVEHRARARGPSRAARRNRRPCGSQRRPGELAAGEEVVAGRTGCRTGRGPGRRSRCPSSRASAGDPNVDRLAVELDRRPASSRCAPLMHLISVDLPAPLSPSRASTSPARTSSATSSSASTAPKRFVTSRTASAGASRPRWALMPSAPPGRTLKRSSTRAAQDVQLDREQDHDADGHQLVEGVDVEQVEDVADDADQRTRRSARWPTFPRPPANAAPPMITAAIESSSASSPKFGDPERRAAGGEHGRRAPAAKPHSA